MTFCHLLLSDLSALSFLGQHCIIQIHSWLPFHPHSSCSSHSQGQVPGSILLAVQSLLEKAYPEISGTDPLIRGFCARTKESRLPDQAPVLHAAGTVPDRPAAVKSTCWTALSPARSDRLPTLQLPWKMLGPSWEIILQPHFKSSQTGLEGCSQ